MMSNRTLLRAALGCLAAVLFSGCASASAGSPYPVVSQPRSTQAHRTYRTPAPGVPEEPAVAPGK